MRRPLSELEGVTLGLVRQHQPCSSYAVRAQFLASPSTRWSASSGSIYPLLRRLEKAGLIAAVRDEADGRGTQRLSITESGVEALRSWVTDGVRPETVAGVSDPLRSRIFFLDLLSPTEADRLLVDAERELRAFLEVTRDRLARGDGEENSPAFLANLGAVREAEARLGWIEEVRRRWPGG